MTWTCKICGRKFSTYRTKFLNHLTEHGIKEPYKYFQDNYSEGLEDNQTEVKNESNMVKEVKIKEVEPDKQITYQYGCSKCGYLFNGKTKFCANCGAEFNWE